MSGTTGLPTCRDSELILADGVATLRFCRDDVRNALTGTRLAEDIIAVCEWASVDERVGALVLTGDGRAFSAGGNVKDMAAKADMFAGDPFDIQNGYRRGIQRMTLAMHRLEIPVIAAVNGPAIGAGLDLACMCDIRIGSARARMAESFVNIGLVPGDGGAWFLPRIVGVQRAAELTFSGRVLDADEALAIGLLLEICTPDELLARSHDMARGFAAKPRRALRMAKRLLVSGQTARLDDFLDHCASLQALAHSGAEHEAALSAVLAEISAKG
jgi:enoyl-CoA hydratase/carnithine racemase